MSVLPLLLAALALVVAWQWADRNHTPLLHDDTSVLPLAVACTPIIRRAPLSASPLPPLDPAHPLNYLARSLRRETQPRLYRAHALAAYRWPAFDRWSSSYFVDSADSSRGPARLLVKRSPSRTVRFANLRTERPFVRTKAQPQPVDGADGVQWPQQALFHKPFRQQNLSTRAFFREIDAQPSSDLSTADHLYFADGVSVLGPVLSQDIVPAEPLCPHADLNECDMSLWIGRAGISAHTHYDSSHNMFAQIRGRKRFVLAPPSAARCGLGLYPSLHPMVCAWGHGAHDGTGQTEGQMPTRTATAI